MASQSAQAMARAMMAPDALARRRHLWPLSESQVFAHIARARAELDAWLLQRRSLRGMPCDPVITDRARSVYTRK